MYRSLPRVKISENIRNIRNIRKQRPMTATVTGRFFVRSQAHSVSRLGLDYAPRGGYRSMSKKKIFDMGKFCPLFYGIIYIEGYGKLN